MFTENLCVYSYVCPAKVWYIIGWHCPTSIVPWGCLFLCIPLTSSHYWVSYPWSMKYSWNIVVEVSLFLPSFLSSPPFHTLLPLYVFPPPPSNTHLTISYSPPSPFTPHSLSLCLSVQTTGCANNRGSLPQWTHILSSVRAHGPRLGSVHQRLSVSRNERNTN